MKLEWGFRNDYTLLYHGAYKFNNKEESWELNLNLPFFYDTIESNFSQPNDKKSIL